VEYQTFIGYRNQSSANNHASTLARKRYNSQGQRAFCRSIQTSSSDGFAIDVKPTLRTILMSGIIVAKVATMGGPALLMLDARKGRSLDMVTNSEPVGEGQKRNMCRNL
jgi:hypothetical protein